MAYSIENIVSFLKEMIDKNGLSYPADEPYVVYTKLTESGTADRKTSAALLHFLASGLWEDAKCGDAEILSGIIRRECSLNKRMSDRLALILYTLHSGEHRKEWKSMELKGLRRFLEEAFVFTWNGFAVWDAGGGTVDCSYDAEVVLSPGDKVSEDAELSCLLRKNPFMTEEAIHDLFEKRLQKYLDNQFEEYCTCEDYYPPVAEDYGSNLEYDLSKWCEENGFEYISSEGDGSTGDYEPEFRRGWY